MSTAPQYTKDMRPASWRGVPFHCISSGDDGGRNAAEHEFAGRDKVLTQDISVKTEGFGLRGFVWGADWLEQAKNLIEACKMPGPGILMHPWRGPLTVVCESYRPNYSTRHSGRVYFDFRFIEEGTAEYPVSTADAAAEAKALAAGALANFRQMFETAAGVLGKGRLSAVMASDVKTLVAMMGRIAGALPPSVSTAQISALLAKAQTLGDQVDGLVSDPGALADEITELIDGAGDLLPADRPADAVAAVTELARFGEEPGSELASLFGGTLQPITGRTPARLAQAENRAALTDLVRMIAINTGIQAAMDMDYVSRQDAEGARDSIVERLDAMIQNAGAECDRDAYQALRQLKANAVKAFSALGRLPELRPEPVPAEVTPALKLSYRLYGVLDRAEEIIKRNPGVSHPGFLPSGESVEVLSA